MAYSELVKNFNRIRDYMREFYVYGFKSREKYTRKSARSYDDEKRRLESWLGNYMKFRQTAEGKNVFISIDSRLSGHNPLFKAWKAKSFTDGDITLHFILFDILSNPDISMSLGEITREVDEYLSQFSEPRMFDESTVRKKLKEYEKEGLLTTERRGKAIYYRRSDSSINVDPDLLDYFSEVLPCGVIGSFLLDKIDDHDNHFAFKHHYITGTMDSEILYTIFSAISEKRGITLEMINRNRDRDINIYIIPVKIMLSVQSGRQYLMAYEPQFKRIHAFRVDHIVSIKVEEISEQFDMVRSKFNHMIPHIWGVNTQSTSGARMEHVEFTIHYADDEQHIKNRLEREKRCGTVVHLDSNTSHFSADVYDSAEMIPWIRTFICRITEVHFSNQELEKRFKTDLEEMYALYGIGGDE